MNYTNNTQLFHLNETLCTVLNETVNVTAQGN